MMKGPFAQYAAHLLEGGYSPVPIIPGTKRPTLKNWDRLRSGALTPAEIDSLSRQNPRLGLGVVGGFNCLVPIDFDTEDKEILRAIAGVLPRPVVMKKGKRGFAGLYWDPTGMVEAAKFQQPLGGGKFAMLVEVLVTGKSVIPPTYHPETRQPYRWLTKETLFNVRIDELSQVTPEHISAVRHVLKPWVPEQRIYERKADADFSPVSDKRQAAYAGAILTSEVQKLACMDKGSGRNICLYHAACKLGKYVHHRIISRSEIERLLMDACQRNGLVKDDTAKACLATIASGFRKAINDALPALGNRDYRRAA